MGANKMQVLKAMQEAEAYPGPSIVIAYSPCIAHGFDLRYAQDHEKMATATGYWPTYRYNPAADKKMTWDSKKITDDFKEFLMSENRYKTLKLVNPDHAEELFERAKDDKMKRFEYLQKLSEL